jgi:hypothetical protein
VIVATPPVIAVTRPADDTVAAPPVAPHVTLAPVIVASFWSVTVAVSCRVSPMAFKLTLVGDTVIEVATRMGGEVGPLAHAASRSTAVSRMYRMLQSCMLYGTLPHFRLQICVIWKRSVLVGPPKPGRSGTSGEPSQKSILMKILAPLLYLRSNGMVTGRSGRSAAKMGAGTN